MNYYSYEHTPVGDIMLVGDDSNLNALYWRAYRHTPAPQTGWIEDRSTFANVLKQLNEYFVGVRSQFDIPYNAHGTSFQQRIWHELTRIPYGERRSYQYIASAVNAPKSVRAVAAAIGRNPLSIIIPCHRVVASSGALAGFAGGLDAKSGLLQLEKRSLYDGSFREQALLS